MRMGSNDQKKMTREEADATSMAFLDERDALYEVANEALNLMAFLDAYWKAHKDHGDRSPVTMVAQGKMFSAMKIVRDRKLRKRILDAQERLNQRERELVKAFTKKD